MFLYISYQLLTILRKPRRALNHVFTGLFNRLVASEEKHAVLRSRNSRVKDLAGQESALGIWRQDNGHVAEFGTKTQ